MKKKLDYEALVKNTNELAQGASICIESAKRIEKAIENNGSIDIDNERILHSAVTAASSAVRSQVAVYTIARNSPVKDD